MLPAYDVDPAPFPPGSVVGQSRGGFSCRRWMLGPIDAVILHLTDVARWSLAIRHDAPSDICRWANIVARHLVCGAPDLASAEAAARDEVLPVEVVDDDPCPHVAAADYLVPVGVAVERWRELGRRMCRGRHCDYLNVISAATPPRIIAVTI